MFAVTVSVASEMIVMPGELATYTFSFRGSYARPRGSLTFSSVIIRSVLPSITTTLLGLIRVASETPLVT